MSVVVLPKPEKAKEGWPWEDTNDTTFDASVQWPKISIVTPSYNQGQYIEETIRSVLLQNYPNLEYIIIDGGSTDNTVEIIKKYAPWIQFWVSEKDRGQSDAINKGLEHCTGEIFNWLNSDDTYLPGTLHAVGDAYVRDPALQFFSGRENHIMDEGGKAVFAGSFITAKLEDTIDFCELTQPSTFFKLDTIKKIGGVNEELHYIMDGGMWCKLLLLFGQAHFQKTDRVLVNFRLHENSKTVSNAVVDNFLLERSSILADLQHNIGVPERMVAFYVSEMRKSPSLKKLNMNWEFNDKVISPKSLRKYYIQKYISESFRRKKFSNAGYGIRELVKQGMIDAYLFKSMVKLILKKS
jgi:glycosyltransferase involved in cell wall biosynthesis